MEDLRNLKWSKTEKDVARKAFNKAYQKECTALAEKVKEMVRNINKPSDLWAIHDFLDKQRRLTDDKYDYRYSVLIFVFARLLREGWVIESDLEGIKEEKINAIKNILSF